jgi:hypothetical protein
MRSTNTACSAAGILCLLATTAYAQPPARYENPTLHYSVSIPDGWEEVPRDVLDEVAGLVEQETGITQQRYEAGFQKAADQWFAYPYVIIQHHRVGNATFEDLAKAFNAMPVSKVLDRLKEQDVVSNMQLSGATIDTDRGLILLPVSMEVAEIGPVRGLSAFKRGREGLVQLSFYARADEFSRYRATIATLLSSLTFAQGYD